MIHPRANDIVFELAKRAGIPDPEASIMSAPPEQRKQIWQGILDAASKNAATDMELESIDQLSTGLGLPAPSSGMMKLGGPNWDAAPQPDRSGADIGFAPEVIGRSLTKSGPQDYYRVPAEAHGPELFPGEWDDQFPPNRSNRYVGRRGGNALAR